MAVTAAQTVLCQLGPDLVGHVLPLQRMAEGRLVEKLWVTLLRLHHARPNLSSVQLDGSHTRTHNGATAIDKQGRKAARTTNLLLLADN